MKFKARGKKVFSFSGALQLRRRGAGQEPCPVILPHMSSSAKRQGFDASAFVFARALRPGWADGAAQGCGGLWARLTGLLWQPLPVPPLSPGRSWSL